MYKEDRSTANEGGMVHVEDEPVLGKRPTVWSHCMESPGFLSLPSTLYQCRCERLELSTQGAHSKSESTQMSYSGSPAGGFSIS
jgi:hypothetical protein